LIYIFYGPPGAGKSYGALEAKLTDELLFGNRLCVTNLPVDIGKLNAWLQTEQPDWKDDINQRLRLITEQDTAQFYCFRTAGLPQLPCPGREESLSGKHVQYPEDHNGVLYIIDEAHIKFDAREWKDAGPELTFYASQHRHLNDEVVFITQHPDMLNNRLRMLAQQFWSFSNHGLEKIFSYFRKPNFFTCEVHRKMPTGNGGPPPEETRRYRLNKKLADCYDTSAGIGITGRKRPEKKPLKGINILWILVPIAIGAYLILKAPEVGAKAITSVLTPEAKKIDSTQTNEAFPVPRVQKDGPGKTEPRDGASAPPVLVESLAYGRKGAIVTLSDGRTLTKGTGLAVINDDWVFLEDGSKYQRQRGKVRMAPAKPAPAN